MTSATAAPAPRYYVASWAARTGQRISARTIDTAVAAVVVTAVLVIGPHGRPFAQDLVIFALVTAIETTSIVRGGATVGMRVVGLHVAPIGHRGSPTWLQAFRRTIPVALCSMILLPGTPVALVMPVVLLTSISLSPLRQAFHDRLSETLVVTDGAPDLITLEMLELWWDPSKGATMTPWGRVPDLHERRRARAHRLDGEWWLAGAHRARHHRLGRRASRALAPPVAGPRVDGRARRRRDVATRLHGRHPWDTQRWATGSST